MRRWRLCLAAVACAAAIQSALVLGGVVINDTPSLPEGFYRKKAGAAEKGSFVLFRLPAGELSARPYARENLIKEVVAVAGDRICIRTDGVRVNGRLLANSRQLPWDRDGLPLPGLNLMDYTLGPEEILTMSTYNPRSFDGRYFGPIQRGNVLSVVKPLLTW